MEKLQFIDYNKVKSVVVYRKSNGTYEQAEQDGAIYSRLVARDTPNEAIKELVNMASDCLVGECELLIMVDGVYI